MRIQKIVILCVLIMILFLSSCFKRSLSDDKDLQFGRSYLGEKLTSHFPNNDVFEKYVVIKDTSAYYNTMDMSLTLFDSDADKRINKVLNEYKNKNIYIDNDSCIVVLNDFINKNDLSNISNSMENNSDYIYSEPLKNYISKIYKNCTDKYKVIPNFWQGYYGGFSSQDQIADTRSHLDRNFKFIIIDSQFSDTATWSPKLDPPKSYMPDPVRHGYSRGIAFNERERIIIYWVILW